jgi:hypothetical protein
MIWKTGGTDSKKALRNTFDCNLRRDHCGNRQMRSSSERGGADLNNSSWWWPRSTAAMPLQNPIKIEPDRKQFCSASNTFKKKNISAYLRI